MQFEIFCLQITNWHTNKTITKQENLTKRRAPRDFNNLQDLVFNILINTCTALLYNTYLAVKSIMRVRQRNRQAAKSISTGQSAGTQHSNAQS